MKSMGLRRLNSWSHENIMSIQGKQSFAYLTLVKISMDTEVLFCFIRREKWSVSLSSRGHVSARFTGKQV